ncbi:hypothetical protein FGIG_02711 [Fasciola gigantica]|uniref:Secreted protein n=1 Tax=Fasciola gigantica TaxID=46835 RepID=A0A504YD86_FASGI|nr:hypothetical protein FGIG_02711 [Fasciola gigantica]
MFVSVSRTMRLREVSFLHFWILLSTLAIVTAAQEKTITAVYRGLSPWFMLLDDRHTNIDEHAFCAFVLQLCHLCTW